MFIYSMRSKIWVSVRESNKQKTFHALEYYDFFLILESRYVSKCSDKNLPTIHLDHYFDSIKNEICEIFIHELIDILYVEI